MLDMGFEPQIKKILKLCPSARQTLMFTATWPEAVRKIAEQFTVDPTHVRIGDGGTRLTANTSITQTVEIIDEDSKLGSCHRGAQEKHHGRRSRHRLLRHQAPVRLSRPQNQSLRLAKRRRRARRQRPSRARVQFGSVPQR
jgi:superfamily II DNA/RNA helicase